MQAGARGYVLKDAEGEETLRAMRVAAGGEAIFSPTIAQRLADYFAAPAKGSATPTEQALGNSRRHLSPNIQPDSPPGRSRC
jgi:DNA-binding NarL/FixJ family response regulator